MTARPETPNALSARHRRQGVRLSTKVHQVGHNRATAAFEQTHPTNPMQSCPAAPIPRGVSGEPPSTCPQVTAGPGIGW